jgi:putative Holliday junction resolvase
MGRVLGVDHGERRSGVAVSDPLGVTVRPVGEIVADTPEAMVSKVVELVREHEVECVVVGHPVNMDGSRGDRARSVEAFAEALGRAIDPIPVELQDERLTTWEAARLVDGKRRRKTRDLKQAVNLKAAELILQNYLQGRG